MVFLKLGNFSFKDLVAKAVQSYPLPSKPSYFLV